MTIFHTVPVRSSFFPAPRGGFHVLQAGFELGFSLSFVKAGVVIGIGALFLRIVPHVEEHDDGQHHTQGGVQVIDAAQAQTLEQGRAQRGGDDGGQGEADGNPAHGQALFPREPVGDDVQAGNVSKAHATHIGQG